MEEGGLRSVFPASLISFSSSLSKAVIFCSNLESQNTDMENFCKVEEHLMCMGRLGFKNDLGWLVLIGLGQGILKSKKAS